MQPKIDVKLEAGKGQQLEVKPTLRRYLIIFLFALNNANKGFQWFFLSANTMKVAYFYDVENYVINGTAIVFLMGLLVLALPACYMNSKLGLRNSMLISSLGLCLGSIIKCFSCHEAGIEILFLGLIFSSLGAQVVMACAGRVASVWFPNEEISTASSINMLGYCSGITLGFLIPQYALNGVETKDGIGAILLLIYQVNAFISVLALIATFIFFDEAPKYPPGQARLKQIMHEAEMANETRSFAVEMSTLIDGFVCLLKKGNFQLLLISYAINEGLQDVMMTVLNQIISLAWPDDEMRTGYVGVIIIVSGIVMSTLIGRILDGCRRYKLTYLLLTLGILFSSIMFGVLFKYYPVPWAVYLIAALFGFCGTGVVVAGPELGIEITYPANEVITLTLLKVSVGAFGILGTIVASRIVDTFSHIASMGFFAATMAIVVALIVCIKEKLLRQNAAKEDQQKETSQS